MRERKKEFIIELTNQCNNQCLHCSSECGHSATNIKELQFDSVVRLTPFLKQSGFNTVIFSGGEPLLHPDILKFAKHYKEGGFEVRAYTSGNFPPDRARDIIGYIDTAVISVHSHRPAMHDYIAGSEGAYSSMLTSVKVFQSADVRIEFNMVPMRLNIHDIRSAYSTFESVATRFNVLKLVKQGHAASNWSTLSYSGKVLREVLHFLKDEPKFSLGNSFGDLSNRPHLCDAGSGKICLTYDGYLLPCEIFKSRRQHFHNISSDCFESIVYTYGALDSIKSAMHGCNSENIFSYLQTRVL